MQTLSTQQIILLNNSFDRLRPMGAIFARLFYERLFDLAPETRQLFKAQSADQIAMVMSPLSAIISAASTPERQNELIKSVSAKHKNYGVQPEQLNLANVALIDTLKRILGDKFRGELEQAWYLGADLLFGAMARSMVGA